jgi:tRNA pseudouridine55 synthase
MLLLDKAAGVSSFAAIARMRPELGRKLGHAGTLDPFATGLLLVLAGRATRLARFVSGLEKTYHATVQLGVISSTDDVEGDLVPHPDGRRVTEAEVAAALPAFAGAIEQVPPAASAIHIDGERAYQRFRRGEVVEMPTRQVIVHAIALQAFDEARQTAELAIRCSTGTYVRAIARDLGNVLGVGGYCATLRRSAIGPFQVVDAAGERSWRSPLETVAHLPQRRLDDAERELIAHGRAIPGEGDAPEVALVSDGRLVAIGTAADGLIRPSIVLEERG